MVGENRQDTFLESSFGVYSGNRYQNKTNIGWYRANFVLLCFGLLLLEGIWNYI